MTFAAVFIGVVLVTLLAAFLLLKHRRSSPPALTQSVQATVAVTPMGVALTRDEVHEVLIGEDPSRPAIRISALTDEDRFGRARQVPMQGSLAGRLNAALQAVPALLTKNELGDGSKFMEVVINGDLVRSSTGEGFRAFTMGEKGIKEHAVLHEAGGLSNVVNAAAVWQVASVVVAQKHLADISAKLDTIVKGVEQIQAFLADARHALIVGTHRYLQQAVEAIQSGELSPALRLQLESCERDLLTTEEHMGKEFRSRAVEDVEHKETVGTEQLADDLVKRYQHLESLAKELELCIKTRVLAWYVLSLFPGEPQLKLARQADIQRSIAELDRLNVIRAGALENDLPKVKSTFNRQKTLDERKERISGQAKAVALTLDTGRTACSTEVTQSANLLITHDKPMTLFVELNNGKLVALRSLAQAA